MWTLFSISAYVDLVEGCEADGDGGDADAHHDEQLLLHRPRVYPGMDRMDAVEDKYMDQRDLLVVKLDWESNAAKSNDRRGKSWALINVYWHLKWKFVTAMNLAF